jgi:hypothetical protein
VYELQCQIRRTSSVRNLGNQRDAEICIVYCLMPTLADCTKSLDVFGGPLTRVRADLRRARSVLRRHPGVQVEEFPGYAPEFNPAEFVWAQGDRSLANSAPSRSG